jgi:hypothetical protein
MNAWLYEKLLLLYPEDLRRDFGAEMTLAFADDIEIMGVPRVWWCALGELLTVALPGQRSNPSVVVPALSFAVSAVTESAELWIGMHLAHGVEHLPLTDSIFVVVLPSLLNAFVAFIVTRFYARCSITVLQLDSSV